MRIGNLRSAVYTAQKIYYGKLFPSSNSAIFLNKNFSQNTVDKDNPVRGVMGELADDLKDLLAGKKKFVVPKHVDILVVGGGIMGSSIAYWLKERAPDSFEIMVVERDPTYTRSSSALSVGGIRQQFSLPENIQLSLYSSKFLRNIRRHLSVLGQDLPDIRFQHHGYLFLASEQGADQLKANHKVQEECGSKVDLMTPKMLKEKFPWINTDGIALGAYGLENEGWFDPWSLLYAFRTKAVSLGALFVQAEVTGFNFREAAGVYLADSDDAYEGVNHAIIKLPNGEEQEVTFSILVVAAGAYSGEVGRLLRIGTGRGVLKYPIPVEPRKRYVYVFHCNDGPGIECPLLIDPNGVYFRREGLGGNYVGGKSPQESEEPDIGSLDVDYTFFDNQVWPVLAERVPAFNAIKLSSAWAGYYDYNTLDQNALIGYHPYYGNVIFATGFSGHGIQMAPAVGRAVMELIIDKQFKTINLERFGLDRAILNTPIFENNIV